jgi:hypothetical protein
MLFVLSTVAAIATANAQYYVCQSGTGNPNNINQEDLEYPYLGGLPSGWAVIHSGNAQTAQWSTVQTLPFAFEFNGNPVTSFKVSTSGVLTFTTTAVTAPSYSNAALPSGSVPAASVCIWGLAGKGSNDYIMQKTFGTAPNRQHWISFTAYSLPAVVGNHYTFWSIVLEETTNAIYIVDQRTSSGTNMALTAGIQIAAGNALMVAGSPSLNKLAGDDPARADNHYYTFLPGSPPVRDLKAEVLLLNDILTVANGPYTLQLVVKNIGIDTIKSLDIAYANTGNLKTTSTIQNLSIAPLGLDTLSHPVGWLPGVGTTIVKIWTENLNNYPDDNPNNDTAFKPVTILVSAPPRVTLLESFTSSTSLPSKDFNGDLQQALSQHTGAVAHLKYPMNWPGTGDPYFTSETGTRRQFYGVTNLPDLTINGANWSTFNYQINDSILTLAEQNIALVDVEASFYISEKTVCAAVVVNPKMTLPATDVNLYMAIYEKTSTQNVKSSGETIFYNIVKKMLPNANGTALSSLSAGVSDTNLFCFTFNGNYTLPANATQPVNLGTAHTIENFNNLGVVAWLQNDVTLEVLQATEATQVSGPIGIEEPTLESSLTIYPNPTTGIFFVSLPLPSPTRVALQVYSLTGQLLKSIAADLPLGNQTIEVHMQDAPAGVYLMHLHIGQEVTVRKIIVK